MSNQQEMPLAGISSNGLSSSWDQMWGSLTGSTDENEALQLAQQEFQYAQQQNNQVIAQNELEDQQSQTQASQQAAAAQASAKATSGASFFNSTPTAIGPGGTQIYGTGAPGGKDLLGL